MNNKESIKYQLILSLLSPALALWPIFRSKNEKFITFAGTLFMGLVGSVYVYIPGTDGATHLQRVYEFYDGMQVNEFFQKLVEILTFKSVTGSADIYMHVISFISGTVFGIPELIHVFTGFILGFFFTKSVLLLLRNKPIGKKSTLLLLFIALFLITRSVTALNSIRMWTAMWILFYGSYSWALTRKRKYLFITLLSVAVHFSYIIILIPLSIAFFIKNRKFIVTGLYILSFIFSLDYLTINSYIPDLALLKQKEKYTLKTDQTLESKVNDKSNLNFYKAWGETAYTRYSIVGLSFILLLFYLTKKTDDQFLFLMAGGLVIYAFSNIVTFSPSLAGRSRMISSTFILASAAYLLCIIERSGLSIKKYKSISVGFWLFLISSVPMALFQISYILNSISIFVFAAPFVSWIMADGDISIREALGLLPVFSVGTP